MNDGPADNANDTTKMSNDWKQNLPESVQGWQEVQTSDSAEKFFDQVANMRKFLGQSIRIPSKDAGEDQREEFYKKLEARVPELMRTPNPEDAESVEAAFRMLGKPEDETGYSYDDASEAELADLRAMAKNVGLTKSQFKKMAEGMLGANKVNAEAAQRALEDEQSALKNDWGAAYDERLEETLNIAEATGASEAMLEAIKNKTIDAHTAKWIHQLGKQLGGEAVNAHVEQKTMAPDEARENIDDILNNPQHPYWHQSHPDHQRAIDKVLDLHRLANA